jgi:hypothetical protein
VGLPARVRAGYVAALRPLRARPRLPRESGPRIPATGGTADKPAVSLRDRRLGGSVGPSPGRSRRGSSDGSETAPAAVRLALPELPIDLWRPSYDAIWQVGAAIQSACGAGRNRPLPSGSSAERESLIDRAVATNDEHAIKFTEACLRQHDAIPDPLFLLAVEDVINRLA